MKFTVRAVNRFVFLKIPSAFFSGVRVREITDAGVVIKVKQKWINQNPFKSMYWATQGMASELATGVLVMRAISSSGEKISMLVTSQKGSFFKKAKGVISFACMEQIAVDKILKEAIESKEGKKITLKCKGIDETGDIVSAFEYEWSVRIKN